MDERQIRRRVRRAWLAVLRRYERMSDAAIRKELTAQLKANDEALLCGMVTLGYPADHIQKAKDRFEAQRDGIIDAELASFRRWE